MQDKQLLGQNMNSKATVNAKTDMSQEPFLPEGFTFKHSPAPLKDLDVSGMDYVKAAGSGALRSIAGVGELAENYLGVGESLRDVATSGADYLQESMTPDAQEAMTRELYTENGSGPFGLGLGNGAGDIDVWAIKAANAIGSWAATFAGGGVAGAGAKTLLRGTITKSMMKKGLTEEVAQAVADKAIQRIASSGAAGAGFGASLGGASMDARDAVMNMDSAWLYENSDFFRDALMRVSDHPENQNLSATQLFNLAKEETANHASLQMSSDPKAIAASAASALGDKVLFNAITGTLGKSITGGALKGAATEASTEALESGTQTYAQNQILNDVAGTNIDPWSGVKSAAAEGGTIGAIVGGVPGAIGGYRGKHSANESSDLAPEQMPIPDDQSEVVNELASQLRGSSSNEAQNNASETIPEGATPIPEEIAPVMSDLGAQLGGDEDAPVSQPLSQDPSIPQPEVKVPQPDDGNQVLNAQETVASEAQSDGITEQFKAMMYAAEQADPNRSQQIIKALKNKNTTTTEKIALLKEFRALASSQSSNEMSQDIHQPASIQPAQQYVPASIADKYGLPRDYIPTTEAQAVREQQGIALRDDLEMQSEPREMQRVVPSDVTDAALDTRERLLAEAQIETEQNRTRERDFDLAREQDEQSRKVTKDDVRIEAQGGKSAFSSRPNSMKMREQGIKPIRDFEGIPQKTSSLTKRLRKKIQRAKGFDTEAVLAEFQNHEKRIMAYREQARERAEREANDPDNIRRREQVEKLFKTYVSDEEARNFNENEITQSLKRMNTLLSASSKGTVLELDGNPASLPQVQQIMESELREISEAPFVTEEYEGNAAKPTQKIEDFGEVLHGAKKHQLGSLGQVLEQEQNERDIISQPLSKSWPKPDVKKLITEGTPAETAAALAIVRNRLSSVKPRKGYKLDRWAMAIKSGLNLSRILVRGDIDLSQLKLPSSMSDVPGLMRLAKSLEPEQVELLTNYRVSSGHYSLAGGQRFDPPKTLYHVIDLNTKRTISEYFETQDQAVQQIKTIIESGVTANATLGKRKANIDVYRRRVPGKNSEYFIGLSAGKEIIPIKDGFSEGKIAREYLVANRTDLENQVIEIRKKSSKEQRNKMNRDRSGVERRNDNVTPENFSDTFGFRGVQFGNWVEGSRRQAELNDAYDALIDLAELINIPPRAISLNGQLGLAFGARGSGKAKAHYEPELVVINLTKTQGAGSLAHEWFHALDNYFGKQSGVQYSEYASDAQRKTDMKGEIRPEMAEAFAELRAAVSDTGLRDRSQILDRMKSKPYWSTMVEMMARSFESYVIDKNSGKNITNDYLANIISQEEWYQKYGDDPDLEYAYPTKVELEKTIAPAFDKFFKTIKHKQDGKNIILYSRESVLSHVPAKGMAVKEATLAADQWLKEYKGGAGVSIEVVKTQAEAEAMLGVSFENSIVGALYSDAKRLAVVVADNIESPKDLRHKLRHEVLVHHGLRAVVGDMEYMKIMERIARGKNSPYLKELWDTVERNYKGFDPLYQVEEVLAHAAEIERPAIKRWFDSIVELIAHALRRVGLMSHSDMTKAEMYNIVQTLSDRIKSVNQWKDRTRPEAQNVETKLSQTLFSQKSRVPEHAEVIKGEPVKGSSIKEKRLYAQQQGFGLTGTYLNKDSGFEISIGRSGVKHTTSKKAFDHLLSTMKFLDRIIEGSLYIGSKPEAKGNANVKAHHYFGIKYELSGQVHDIVVDVREMPDGKFYYDHSFEKGSLASGGNDSGPRLLPLEPDNNTSRVAEANKSVSIEDKAVKGVSNNTKGEDLKFSRKVKEQTLTPELAEKLGLGPKKSKAELAKEFAKELVGKSKGEWLSVFDEAMKRVNTGWFDGLAPIKYVEDKAGITNAEDSGYVAARLAAGSSSVMQAVMLYGIPEWKDGIIQKRDNTGEADSLLGIFDELGKDLHNWLAWMAGNRAKQLKTQGRENLLSEDEINELLLLGEAKQEAFKRAKAKYNAMNKALLDLAQDAGLIDKDSRNEWESEWYVPFYRQDDKANEKGLDSVIGPWKGRGIANQSAQIKKLKGSDKNINDILENIFINTGKLVDASMKNMAMQKVVYNLADTDLIEVVPKPNLMQFKAADAVHVKVEGEDYLVKVADADLFRAMTQIDMERTNHPFMKVARGAKRLLTSTVTVSPDFMLRNFLRDSLSSWAISKDDFTPIVDSFKGVGKTLKKADGTLDMMFSGASFLGGYVNGNDPQAMADSVRKALKRKGLSEADIRKYQNSLITDKSQLMGALSKGWDKYIEFGEGLENASREAVYEAAIKAGKTKAQAVFEAKDLMDFSLHGNSKVAMFLGDVLPFFNARLQGLGKLARESKANPVQIAQRGGMIAAASVALVLINGNDERYQELPDWDKDMNWHFWFGDQHWRVPKPFEIGVLFGTFPERIVNAAFYEDSMEDLRNAFGRNLVSTFALNPVPQVVNPLVEAYFNYSMFRGQPIENMADLSMMPEARYNERTSITMREIGELTGMSPKKLEHIFNGYLGTVGSYTLWMSDYVARQMGDYGAKPALKAQDLLVIKSVYQGSDRARSTKYLDDMYKMMREAEELYRTVNEYRKDGRFERARELMEDRGKILNARKPLKETQKQVRQLNSQIDFIMRSKELTAEEKRKRIDRKIEQRNAIVAATVKRVNPYFD